MDLLVQQQRSVLVIEDDDEIRETLRDILEEEGYAVRVAENGLVGLHALSDDPPDLIVLDLMMPVMNGAEFRERQLTHPEWARIPVVIISAAPPTGSWRAGGARFLRKPFSLDAILSAVDAMSRGAEAAQANG